MPVRYQFGFTMMVLVGVLLSACTAGGRHHADDAVPRHIGWLHDNCLALDGEVVSAGARVAVVAFGEDGQQRDQSARVLREVTQGDECPALLEDRQEINRQDGRHFYLIDAAPMVALGIGVVQTHAGELPVPVLLDTNSDGRRDTFDYCSSQEGVHFSVWSGAAWRGDRLWHGYYYLDYETESDCPSFPGLPIS